MKKVFSLLLVVAMLFSMAVVVSAAEPVKGMKHTITETDSDITVTVTLGDLVNCRGFVAQLISDAVTYVDGSLWVNPAFDTKTNTPTGSTLKVAYGMGTETPSVTEAGEMVVATYKVVKTASDKVLSAADFAYGTKLNNVSKVQTATGGTVAGIAAGTTNFTSGKTASKAYFTIEYVDARTPIVEDKFINDEEASVAGTTLTFAGRVGAEWMDQAYGVEFTSNKAGTRAQKYYGAKNGDTVALDAEAGTTQTFTFGAWDGTFEIILTNVSAGAKEFKFFVGNNYTDAAVVTVQ